MELRRPIAPQLVVSESDKGLQYWLARPYAATRTLGIDPARFVLLLPEEGRPDYPAPVFGPETRDLLTFLEERLEPTVTVDACITEEQFRQVSLRGVILDLGAVLVSVLVLPALSQLLATYIQKWLESRSKGQAESVETRFEMTVERQGEWIRTIRYCGPPGELLALLARLESGEVPDLQQIEVRTDEGSLKGDQPRARASVS